MITTVRLSIKCRGSTIMKKLHSVLVPDSQNAPNGLAFSMRTAGATLSFGVESDSPSQTLSTAIAVLQDISLFQEIWLLSTSKDA